MIDDVGTPKANVRRILVGGVFFFLYTRFWDADQLNRVCLKRIGRTCGQALAELRSLSDVFAALSPKPEIVICRGATSCLLQLLDLSEIFQQEVQTPYLFETLSVHKLMHK